MKGSTNYESDKETLKDNNRKKFGKFIKEKKKETILIIVLIVIILGFTFFFLVHGHLKNTKTDLENVTEYIEKLGKGFYEDYYYLQLKDLKENHMIEDIPNFLENFVTTGIPITLNQILELQFKTEKEINKSLKRYQCDFETTGFIIYPEDPYEKKSYRLEPHIACENLDN